MHFHIGTALTRSTKHVFVKIKNSSDANKISCFSIHIHYRYSWEPLKMIVGKGSQHAQDIILQLASVLLSNLKSYILCATHQ